MTKEIDISVLVKEYHNADKQGKEMLIRLYGADAFQLISADAMNRFKQACEDLGLTADSLLHTGAELDIEQQVSNAYTMLRVLAKATRNNWEPDWSNGDQRKWYSWFEYTPSGFVVNDTNYYYLYTNSFVGSRLCFPNSEMAKSFTEKNLELYNIILSN